jgi:hypothetical protein
LTGIDLEQISHDDDEDDIMDLEEGDGDDGEIENQGKTTALFDINKPLYQ